MSALPRSRPRIRRLALAAAPAALVLAVFGAGHAAASDGDKYGTVAIIDADSGQEMVVDGQAHVCNFFFEFDLGIQADVVGWKVKEWNAAPLDGTTVLKGQGGPTDADGKLRVPDSGSLTVPNGNYNIVWDDEYPPDGSNGVRSFVVDCAAEEPAEEPPPPPTDNGTDLGVGGTAGGDAAAAGNITPPPTDTGTVASASAADNSGLIAAIVALTTVVGGVFLTSWRRVGTLARRRSR
ncbi:MAG: hypothetical protein ACJ76W_04895 [Chloroflexota bacterium]